MTFEDLRQRANAHKRDLFADIPVLVNLRSSRIDTLNQISSSGVYMDVFLEEIPQMSLQFAADKSGRSVLTDLFLQEVELVRSQQKEIRQRISKAASPALDPFKDGEMSSIRKRLKRRGKRDGEFLVATGPEPEPLRIDNFPNTLPRGCGLEVVALVNWLSPKKAELRVVDIVSLEGDGINRLVPNTKIELLRLQSHRRPESGRRLQEAMDTRSPLKLRVTAAFQWTTGEPRHLELVDFVGDMNGNTSIGPGG